MGPGLLDPFVIMKNVKDAESLAIDILTFLTGISSRDGEKFPVLRKAVRSVTQSDSRGLLHVIDELRREDTPISRNIADHIDSFTDYDFAHLLFSDGTVENAISLDNQLNIIQVADLVLPDKDTTFEEYTTIELLSVSMLIVISTFALDFIHSDRSIFKIVDLDEAWAFLNVAQGETLSNKLVRAGRAMQAGVYFVTQSSGDVAKESLKNNIGLKFAFRSTDINEIKQTLEFFGIDKDDENNQKRLRDLENGQCLLQDLYGRVGVVQIHPVFEELLHAFDTRPPVQRNEVDGKTREEVVKTEIEDNDNNNLTIPQVVNRLGMVFFLLFFNLGITIFVFLLTGMMLFSQILFIIFAMFLPISFLLSMIPSYESMAKQAIVRVFNTIMTRAGITLIVTVAFSISSMFYNISTDYPFFMVAFLQIVCFAGIYMKLGDLMSMFSLNANDSQSMGRRIFRRPYLFMRHRARRMEHRIARAVSAGGISGGVAGAVAGSAVAGKRAERKNTASKKNRGNTTSSMGQRAGSKVGAVLDTKNKVKDKANAVKENIKGMPTQTAYAVYSAKEKAKSSVSDFKRGMVQEQQSRQTGRLEKQEQRRQNIADKRMELQKAQEARHRKTDGSATTGATRPHERPATASTIPKPSAEKTQEVKRPATATTSKISEPVKTNVIKERPLSSGASDKKAPQPTQTVHRQNVEKVVSQETRQNDTKDRRIKVQQTQSVQKNQQTIEKTRNLVTKKGQKKK